MSRRKSENLQATYFSLWQKHRLFMCSACFGRDSFNPHLLFTDSIQSYVLCHHRCLEALCWIQSPAALCLPARAGLALSRRTVSLPEELFQLASPALPYTNDGVAFKIKALTEQQFYYHQFKSTQFGRLPLFLESVCQFKEAFGTQYLCLRAIIVSRAKMTNSLRAVWSANKKRPDKSPEDTKCSSYLRS